MASCSSAAKMGIFFNVLSSRSISEWMAELSSRCTLITMESPSRGLMFLARLAYLSVLSVSSNWSCAGETLLRQIR